MNTLVAQSSSLKSLVTRRITSEFRAKMRQAEDLISKLGYSLREMQDHPTSGIPSESSVKPVATVAQLFNRK